jgi:TolB protein
MLKLMNRRRFLLLLLALLAAGALFWWLNPDLALAPSEPESALTALSSQALLPSPSATETVPAGTPTPSLPTATPTRTPLPPDSVSTLFLAIDEGGYSRLYAFAPGVMAPLRLTNGPWNDKSPALSPDGRTLAFASDRNEYWDIYLLDLASGQVSRLTDTPAYDSSPRWSPDGLWIVFDSYSDDNFEILIASTVNIGEIIRLTDDPASDQRPAWSPSGRQIAFASDRSGDFEIWVANLDTPGENRYQNISRSPNTRETNPVWSPDGSLLAWEAASLAEPPAIYVWDTSQPQAPARFIGPGSLPAWNQFGDQIAAAIREPNQDYLLAYQLDGFTSLPAQPSPPLYGISWRTLPIGGLPVVFQRSASQSPTPLFNTPLPAEGRADLLPLGPDVSAPQPYLHQSVIPAFEALRQRAILETGWDVLANLENAHTPLTTSLDPGRGDSWLYTGRAFGINPLPLNAGWMYILREDYNGQTFWRVYLRPQAQDGSMGEPLRAHPWNMNARYSLSPMAYEQGGQLYDTIPTGYWVDFTRLARVYGWQRQPAQTNWRTYFKGALFNEFVIPGSLSWRDAMLELYPPDILITPTIVIPPTRTPTPTPTGYRYKTPTPTPSFTPTMRPTFTPAP